MRSHWIRRGVVCACLLFAAAVPGRGDWDPGNLSAMHFPQLPNASGWAVRANQDWAEAIADDWQASANGKVTQLHFWFSSKQDQDFVLGSLYTGIFTDVPAGVDGIFSHPGTNLWERFIDPSEYSIRAYGTGDQGWDDPLAAVATAGDHQNLWQVNITLAPEVAFEQAANTTYWLGVGMSAVNPADPLQAVDVGWSTSLDNWNGAAVFSSDGPPNSGWQPLSDPVGAQPLDFAFVAVPEPGVIGLLLAAGGAGFLVVRFRRARRA